MSRDSVRYGRQPKRSQEADPSDNLQELKKICKAIVSVAPAPTVESVAAAEAEALRQSMADDLVKLVTSAYYTNNTYTDELRLNIVQCPMTVTVSHTDTEETPGMEAASSTTGPVTDTRLLLWRVLAVKLTVAVSQVVDFAKRLPGFHTLPQDDQLILIKLGFFELWLTRASRLSTHEAILFDDGTAISRSQLSLLYDPSFASALLSYVWSLLQLHMSNEEMATYTGCLVYCHTRENLIDPDRIQALYNGVFDALRLTVMSSGPDGAARLETLMAAAQEARAIGQRHHELLDWCRDRWMRISLPALFSEMFDIPVTAEEAASIREAKLAAAVAKAQCTASTSEVTPA